MPKVTFTRQFKYSPNGYDVEVYEAGPAEVSDECAELAAECGALEPVKAKKEPEPDNKPPAKRRNAKDKR